MVLDSESEWMTVFWQQKHAIREHACRKKAAFYVRIKQHSNGTIAPCGHNGDSGILWGYICASNAGCDDSKLSAECRYAWHSVTACSRQYSGSNGIWTAVLRQLDARPPHWNGAYESSVVNIVTERWRLIRKSCSHVLQARRHLAEKLCMHNMAFVTKSICAPIVWGSKFWE